MPMTPKLCVGQTLIKRLVQIGRILLLCLILSAPVCSPAYAKCGPICPGDEVADTAGTAAKTKDFLDRMKEFVVKLGELTGIAKLINGLTPLFTSGVTKTEEQLQLQTAARVAMKKALLVIEAKKHEDEINAKHAQEDINAQAQQAGDRPVTDMKKSPLCLVVNARQMMPIMDEFANLVAKYVTLERVRDRAGNGFYAAARTNNMRYGLLNRNDPPMGSALNGDPEPYWGAEDVLLAPGLRTSFRDASLSAATLNAGTSVYNPVIMTIPKISPEKLKISETEEIDVSVPIADAGDVQQQEWIAARDYCMNMAGAAPISGRVGEGAIPNDITKASDILACRTARDLFFVGCAFRLGQMTRPNCKEEALKPFCKASKISCLAAIGAGLNLPDSYENCTKGLSAHETKLIAVYICDTTTFKTQIAAAGAATAEILGELSYTCEALKNALVDEKKAEEDLLMKASMGLRSIPGCWKGPPNG